MEAFVWWGGRLVGFILGFLGLGWSDSEDRDEGDGDGDGDGDGIYGGVGS